VDLLCIVFTAQIIFHLLPLFSVIMYFGLPNFSYNKYVVYGKDFWLRTKRSKPLPEGIHFVNGKTNSLTPSGRVTLRMKADREDLYPTISGQCRIPAKTVCEPLV